MKKLSYIVLLLVFFLFFQACNSSEEAIASNTIKNMKGYYIYGVEVSSFQPCGSKNVYWVVGSNKILAELSEGYEKLNTKAYGEVFAIIKGKYIGKAEDGFAEDYDDQIQAEEISILKKKTGNECK